MVIMMADTQSKPRFIARVVHNRRQATSMEPSIKCWTLYARIASPMHVDTTLETVSNDILFEVILEHYCIDKEPGWCEALGRTILLNMVGNASLGLTSKGVKGFVRRVFLRMKTASSERLDLTVFTPRELIHVISWERV